MISSCTYKITHSLRLLAILFLLSSTLPSRAQNEITPQEQTQQVSDTNVYRGVTKRAGQPPKWNKYLVESMKFPKEFRKDDVSVRITIEFIVEKDGRLSHPEARINKGQINGKEASIEQLQPFIDESFRVILNSPEWIPAINNEAIVRSYFICPLEFRRE